MIIEVSTRLLILKSMGLESFLSFILKPIAKEVYSLALKNIKFNNKTLKVNQKNIEDALRQHINKVNTFTSEISFRELNKPKSLHSVYIPLDISVNLIKSTSSSFQNNNITDKTASTIIENVFKNSHNNVVLVGTPGSGKTTTLKFICQKLFSDENFLGNNINFPILIRLREDEILNNKAIPLFEYILNVFGVIIENTIKCTDSNDDKNQLDRFKKQIAISIIDNHSPLLVLDGFDEISDEQIKSTLLKNINDLSLSSSKGRFILTTRKGEDFFHIDNTQFFELSPLNLDQIKTYCYKWLGDVNGADFLKKLQASSVFDSATKPLTLSHLCAIYEKEETIPDKSKSIYKKIVNLLILDWNLENQIQRESKFSLFTPDRKKEFLENLAFELSVFFNKNQFNTNDLEKCYGNFYMKFGLPYTQMPEVINEIQVHNGLITQIAFDKFEFAHKSFQEYLAADYIVKLVKIPSKYNLLLIPSEMALAVTLSSDPTDYFNNFIDPYLIESVNDYNFLKSFFTRLSIEKPDFIDSDAFGVSIIKLHDKYCRYLMLETVYKNNESSKVTQILNLINESFETLLWFENIKNSFVHLGGYYNITRDKKNPLFLKMALNKPISGHHFPEIFFISQNFYSIFLSDIFYFLEE